MLNNSNNIHKAEAYSITKKIAIVFYVIIRYFYISFDQSKAFILLIFCFF